MQNLNRAWLVFTRQNRQFEVDKNLALNFLNAYPDNRTPVALALRRHFTHKKESLYTKSQAQLDEIWAGGDKHKRRELLRSKGFIGMLAESQAQDILVAQDPSMLETLYGAMARNALTVLPLSPRLSTYTRIKLMKAAIVAHEPERLGDNELDEVIRKRIRISSALALGGEEFPQECILEDFRHSSISSQYVESPALSLMHAPIESSLCLLMKQYIWKQQAVLDSYELQLRHGFWERVMLRIAKEETPFSFRELLALCDYGDLENANPELISALFEIGHPLVHSKIIYSGLLTAAQRDRAWQNGDVDVCRNLLKLPEFLAELTENQARDIMAVNDIHMIQTIATNIHSLCNIKDGALPPRLRPETHGELLKFILTHPDKCVQRLLGSQSIPRTCWSDKTWLEERDARTFYNN